jgi:hypothetical protein
MFAYLIRYFKEGIIFKNLAMMWLKATTKPNSNI